MSEPILYYPSRPCVVCSKTDWSGAHFVKDGEWKFMCFCVVGNPAQTAPSKDDGNE